MSTIVICGAYTPGDGLFVRVAGNTSIEGRHSMVSFTRQRTEGAAHSAKQPRGRDLPMGTLAGGALVFPHRERTDHEGMA